MRKDSANILGVSVLLTAGIVGSAHLLVNRSASASIPVKNHAESAQAPIFERAIGSADVSAETPSALAGAV